MTISKKSSYEGREGRKNPPIIDFSTAGFAIKILEPKYEKIRGYRVLVLNHNQLFADIFVQLIDQEKPYTGNQLRYIRTFLELTREVFGRVMVNGSSIDQVRKWEAHEESHCKMPEKLEGFLRLELYKHPTYQRYLHENIDPMATAEIVGK